MSDSTPLISAASSALPALKKVVLLGFVAPPPGKTSLYTRVIYDIFSINPSTTTGAYFSIKEGIALWDTSFSACATSSIVCKEAAIFVDCVSIKDVDWESSLSQLSTFHKQSPDAPVVIMVTMCDKDMTDEQTQRLKAIKEYAREHNLTLYYSSAKDNLLHDINGTSIEGGLNGGFISELDKIKVTGAPKPKSTTQKWSLFFAQIGFLLIAIGFALSPPIFTPADAWVGAPFLMAGGALFLAISVGVLSFNNWFKELWSNDKLWAIITLAIGIALVAYPLVVSSITEAFGATAIVAQVSFIVSGISMLVGSLSGIWQCCRQPSSEIPDYSTGTKSPRDYFFQPAPNTVPPSQVQSTSYEEKRHDIPSMNSSN